MTTLALAFLGGCAVLILEILGTRLLAPLYGSTVYVWSALITVTLAALACGYAGGGSLADRARSLPRALGWALLAAGAWLLAVPALRKPLLTAASALDLRLGALAGAAALLGPPLFFLGALSPLCVRMRTAELARVGRAVGSVSAVSTAGSVAGALAAGFWLIPSFGVNALLYGLSALLLILSAGCFWKGRSARAAALGVLAALVPAFWALKPEPERRGVRLHRASFYGDITVVDWRDKRILYIDGVPNTVADIATLESLSDYIRSFELAAFLRPSAKKALLIGLGGGGIVKRLGRHYAISTDVVDIDPVVARAAQEWFGLVPTGRFALEDGRRFLEKGSDAYDLVYLDAFNGDQHPFHLFTREAMQSAERRMTPEGVLAINLIAYAQGPRAGLRRAMESTLRSVFPHVRVLVANTNIDPREDCVNLTFLASRAELSFRRDPRAGRPEIAEYYAKVAGNFLEPEGEGPLLTDDRNPVDALSAPAFLDIRRHNVAVGRELLL